MRIELTPDEQKEYIKRIESGEDIESVLDDYRKNGGKSKSISIFKATVRNWQYKFGYRVKTERGKHDIRRKPKADNIFDGMHCPICGKETIGKIRQQSYYCSNCFSEMTRYNGGYMVYRITEEGNTQLVEKLVIERE